MGANTTTGFAASFVSKSGKVIRAIDYGHKAWPIGRGKKKKK